MVDTSHSGSVETLTRLEASFQSSVRETKPTLESSSLPIHGMELSIHREALKKDHEEEDPEQGMIELQCMRQVFSTVA